MNDALMSPMDPERLTRAFEFLLKLRTEIVQEADELFEKWRPTIRRRTFVPSALNLLRYVVFRRRDLSSLQGELALLGLSSLGRGEPRVLANLDAVLATLGVLAGADASRIPSRPRPSRFYLGERLLERDTRALFGPPRPTRAGRIMVTLPSEAALEEDFVLRLAQRGADCFRINCAHDDRDAWGSMILHVRRAAALTERRLPIVMDVAGPKVRIAHASREGGRVHVGEEIRLVSTPSPSTKEKERPIDIQASEPTLLERVRVGDSLAIDDGKVRALVESTGPGYAVLRVRAAAEHGVRLRSGKSINAPGVTLALDALTDKDLADLDFVGRQADLVGYSFVQSADDVRKLQLELAQRAGRVPPLILKIETEKAVRALPEIILAAAGERPAAVMIARGDLAVEIGYLRLAEIQEEILWLSEAAHVPVIWATQVLEHLVKKGLPTRAEITDAAMGERAECVMLNKGPYVAEAVGVLDDLLSRMARHQYKKTPTLRPLHF